MQDQKAGEQGSPGKWLCFLSVSLGTFVTYSDSSMVNIALPTIARYFGVGLGVVELIVTSYLLMITGLVIIFGRLGDIHGRRRVYLIGFGVFTAASALCGAAPALWALVLFRCLQGIGAAMLLANGVAVLTESFPGKERGRVLGAVGSVIAAAVITGPPLGGFLADQLGWRAMFYVNLPAGIAGLVLAMRVLPRAAGGSGREKFDVRGAVISFAALGCLLITLKFLSTAGLSIPVAGMAILTLILAGTFLRIESRVEHPLLDLSLFRSRTFSAASVSAYLSFWALSSISFLIPFYLDRVLRLSPTASGYVLAPVALLLVVTAPLGGFLADRFGVRAISTAGAAINCLGLLSLSTLSADTTLAGVLLRLVPFGIGSGLFQPPNNSAMMGAVPATRIGIASAMISAMKNFGSMSGVAVTSLVFTMVQMSAIARLQTLSLGAEAIEREAFVTALRAMFLLSAGISLIAVVASMIRGTGGVRGEEDELAPAGT